MRRTLGTAVFAGMLGVTLFGIFLTPVFYYVIQWFKDRYESESEDDDEMNEHTPLAYFISGLGHGLKEIEGRNGVRRLSPDQRATLERGLSRDQGTAARRPRPRTRTSLTCRPRRTSRDPTMSNSPRRLGKTGPEIGPIAFGGNVFGWTADESMSLKLLDAAVAAGFNLIDTADVYSRWVPGHKAASRKPSSAIG